MATSRVSAQVSLTGQSVTPVYEGWEKNPDGSFNLVFGYFNRNWEEELDVPVGAENRIEPGDPDQGQPTHFFPRQSRFIFRIRVPEDFGKKEVVWTLVTHGKTAQAYATLIPDYAIDDTVIQNNNGGGSGGGGESTHDNRPPTLEIAGEKARVARVGQAVTLTAFATDDGIPKPRPMPPPLSPETLAQAGTPRAATGLRLAWFVYRGAGKATFDPPQFEVWEDLRDGRNSPWSSGWVTPAVPPDGKWVTQVTFGEPGKYVLRCLAHDGGLMVSQDVTFVVSR
jgi:hypothetical protein